MSGTFSMLAIKRDAPAIKTAEASLFVVMHRGMTKREMPLGTPIVSQASKYSGMATALKDDKKETAVIEAAVTSKTRTL